LDLNPFTGHVPLMAAGTLFVFAAVLIAKTLRRKPWWLRTHRIAGVSGTVLIAAGAAAAIALVTLSSGEHLRTPHAWLGALTVAAAVVTPVLGLLQFRLREKAAAIRLLHRGSGRIAAASLLASLLLGLRLTGRL
jgi:hypothetical protein